MPHSQESARQLHDVVRRLVVAHGTLNPGQRPCGAQLSTSHAWALLELLDSGPLTVKALAERLNIDRTNVSRLCSRLLALGEVSRTAHPQDGRAVVVTLTAKGAGVARSVRASSTAHFQRVLAQLDAPEDVVIPALNAVVSAMTKVPIKEILS